MTSHDCFIISYTLCVRHLLKTDCQLVVSESEREYMSYSIGLPRPPSSTPSHPPPSSSSVSRPSARGTLKPSSPSRPTSRRAALYDSPPVRGTLNPYPSPARSAWRRAAPDDMPGGGALNDVTLQQRTLKSRLNSAILKLSEEEALRKLENKSVSDTHGL